MTTTVLNCRIPSDVEELEKLRVIHPWLPGRDHIRPTPEQKKAKLEYFEMIKETYNSESDYALQTVFGFEPETDPATGKLRVVVPETTKATRVRRFDRNMWPYALPAGTKHWTIWYAPGGPATDDDDGDDDDDVISRDVFHDLEIRMAGSKFEFGWYKNPKMTIPSIPHYQVFWHRVD